MLLLIACYDKGSSFLLFSFLNDGAPQPKIVGNTPFVLHDSLCVPRPSGFSSGSSFIFSRIPGSFLEEVSSSQVEERQQKSGVYLYRSTRLSSSATTTSTAMDQSMLLNVASIGGSLQPLSSTALPTELQKHVTLSVAQWAVLYNRHCRYVLTEDR